ncbi:MULTISPECIES: hypothetical protein [unclassified Streptomyces]|uniref:hypothetical protein n=1 Tax=unclassified Streptomyces TaxID=2593676 RepID=UPI00099D603B|nr:hypothetical protein [Streptomyces sp. NRRL F-5727]
MEQITMRSRPRVPAITCGSSATSSRLDRHLAVLGGPAVPQRDVAEATLLMRELTTRRHEAPVQSPHVGRTRVSLFAPLRRLRRTLFGAHH